MARPRLSVARTAILDGMDPTTRPAAAPRAERRRLSHVDRSGRPRMVDVSDKPVTARRAVAEATVAMSPDTMSLVIDGGGAKGDVLGVAELAGVMGGKRTSELIPLCHPLALTDLQVSITPDRAAGVLRIRAEAATTGQTGVEMEAMTAATRRRADRLRHGQGRRARRRDRRGPARQQERRQERRLDAHAQRRAGGRRRPEARRPRARAGSRSPSPGVRRAGRKRG